jgi:hypothetical protein
VGTLLGEDRKSYTFRRTDVRAVWFHDLTERATVASSLARPFGDPGFAQSALPFDPEPGALVLVPRLRSLVSVGDTAFRR